MSAPPTRRRLRILAWLGALGVIALDALIATPVGLPVLYFAPIVVAAFWLPRAELLALTILCSAARILFGPVGDPLHLAQVTLTIGEDAQVVSNALTTVVGYVGAGWLIATLAGQRREIQVLAGEAETDPLTGLANRRALDAFLVARRGEAGAVLVVDLDHFKRVNDTYGHAAGDEVLKETARRLRPLVRQGDMVARSGGEELVIVLREAPTRVAERVAADVCEALRRSPVEVEGATIPVTASVGVCAGTLDDALVAAADAALYEAKRGGRDRWVAG